MSCIQLFSYCTTLGCTLGVWHLSPDNRQRRPARRLLLSTVHALNPEGCMGSTGQEGASGYKVVGSPPRERSMHAMEEEIWKRKAKKYGTAKWFMVNATSARLRGHHAGE